MAPLKSGRRCSIAIMAPKWLFLWILVWTFAQMVVGKEADSQDSDISLEGDIKTGAKVTIKWGTDIPEPVVLFLGSKVANSGNVTPNQTIGEDAKGGEYSWTVPNLDAGEYVVYVIDADKNQHWSQVFTMVDEGDSAEVLSSLTRTPTLVPTTTTPKSETAPTQTGAGAEPTDPAAAGGGGEATAGASSKLSGGAKAGIGAGVAAVSILMLALLAMLRQRRKLRKAATSPEEYGEVPTSPRSPRSLRSPGPHSPIDAVVGGRRSPSSFAARTVSPRTIASTPAHPDSPRTVSPSMTPGPPGTPKSTTRGIFGHLERALSPFTPRIRRQRTGSWPTATSGGGAVRSETPMSNKSPTPSSSTPAPQGYENKKVVVVGPPLTELPGDDNWEVPSRAELPTPANTPELPEQLRTPRVVIDAPSETSGRRGRSEEIQRVDSDTRGRDGSCEEKVKERETEKDIETKK